MLVVTLILHNVNVKYVIMIQKIEKILMQYANHEIWFNEAHSKLCDLHNVMLRDSNTMFK